MSATESNIALFREITALASVDYQRAAALARNAELIVKARNGQVGVLVGVTWLGVAEVEFDQRTRTDNGVRFTDIEATGFTAGAGS